MFGAVMKSRPQGEGISKPPFLMSQYCEIYRLLQSIAHENVLRDGEIIVNANGLLCVIQSKSFFCSV